MITFKDIIETVYEPRAGDEKNFKDKHIVSTIEHPHATEFQFKGMGGPKAKRKQDYDTGEDEAVYEAVEVHTKRADKEAVIVRAVDSKTGQSKAKTVQRRAGEIKIEETKLDERVRSPYAIGMAAAMKATGDEPPLEKSTIKKGHKIAKSIMKKEDTDLEERIRNPYAIGMAAAMKAAKDQPPLEKSTIMKGHKIAKSIMKKEAMDPVGREDSDIDNDGDTDKSDRYLHARRKAIAKAMKKEEAELNEAVKIGAMKLHDGNTVQVSREMADKLNSVLEQLNPMNRGKMEARMHESKEGFNEIMKFAETV